MGKASTRAHNKYNAKAYDRVNLTLPKGQKEVVQTHAATQGESVNGFIGRAISEAMERDTAAGSPTAAAGASDATGDIPAPETPQNATQPVSAPAIAIPDIPLEKLQQARVHAEARREPISGFLVRAIDETIERDKNAPAASRGDSEGGLNDND